MQYRWCDAVIFIFIFSVFRCLVLIFNKTNTWNNFYKCVQLHWHLHHLALFDLATSWLTLWMTNQDFCPTKRRCYRWRQIVWLSLSAAHEQPHFSLQIDGVGVNLHLWTRGDKDDISKKHRHFYISSSRSPNFAIDGIVVNSQFWPRGRNRRHLFKYAKKPALEVRKCGQLLLLL